MPRFEKVDDYHLKVIIEKADKVTVSHLLENQKKLREQRTQINIVLDNIAEMLNEAAKLGVIVEPEKPTKDNPSTDVVEKKPTS